MKHARYGPAVLRVISSEKADRRRQPRTTGAFAKTGKPGQSVRGDTSTRNALARILGDGESLLLKALRGLSTEMVEVNGKSIPKPLLPSNWGGAGLVHDVDGGQSWFGWRTCRPEVFENVARRGGWMKAMGELIAENPGFFRRACKALAKNPSRGMNSPANKGTNKLTGFLTGDSLERWKTPGRAFRAIEKGVWRAREILAGFNITNVPWTVVTEELAAKRGPQRGHKLGQRLALKTLEKFTGISVTNRVTEFAKFRGFRHDAWRAMAPEVREFYLMKMREELSFSEVVIPPIRTDDGVGMFVTSETTVCQHKLIEGYASRLTTDRRGRRICGELVRQTLVVSLSGRTYHVPWWPTEVIGPTVITSNSWSHGQYQPGDSHGSGGVMTVPVNHESVGQTLSGEVQYWRRFAVRIARKAWKVQDERFKTEGLERPTDRSVLVFIQDSLSAGNCIMGTKAFVQTNGWGERKFVPAQWLLEKEPRARATAKVALARYWASQQQMAA